MKMSKQKEHFCRSYFRIF